jgi:uroporphyrinogen-III synthase
MHICASTQHIIVADSQPLAGCHILVTRPKLRAATFAERITAAGGESILFPVIEIRPPLDTRSRDAACANITRYQMAIFISPTAVEQTLHEITSLPDSLSLVAIGKSTADALKQYGYTLAFEGNTTNSETLLAQTPMLASHIRDQRVIIFRGEGGRELLADTLRQRGAQVDYADMYRRAAPDVPHLQNEQLEKLDAICVTSNQGLEQLVSLCDDLVMLKQLALFVPGERCATLAESIGFSEIHIADDATDASMLRALMLWASNRRIQR